MFKRFGVKAGGIIIISSRVKSQHEVMTQYHESGNASYSFEVIDLSAGLKSCGHKK
jgi:hypothetical protein